LSDLFILIQWSIGKTILMDQMSQSHSVDMER
jgi:hypothetical protein